MPLTCYCDNDEDYEWTYEVPEDFSLLPGKRRKRCSSCRKLISLGADVAQFTRSRPVRNNIEERIYGEDGQIEIASMYLCEECAGLFFSLYELGFECISPDENMQELVEEYGQEYLHNLRS